MRNNCIFYILLSALPLRRGLSAIRILYVRGTEWQHIRIQLLNGSRAHEMDNAPQYMDSRVLYISVRQCDNTYIYYYNLYVH